MTIEHPIGVEPMPEWAHNSFYRVEVGDYGAWTIHIWRRVKDGGTQYKCTISSKRPFNFSDGWDSIYDAINQWMHVGDES